MEAFHTNRLTRLGYHFLFIGAFAMLGGALRGFNLLLVLAGMMVGVFVMHWRWSLRSIESMLVDRRLPSEAFAGKPFRVRYRLSNQSRLMPAWMLRIDDQMQSTVDSDKMSSVACGIGVVSPQRMEVTSLDCLISRRGLYQFDSLTLSTSFPFALFLSRKGFATEQFLHVFPRLAVLSGAWRRHLVSRSGGMSTTVRRSGLSEGDFFGLREWQSGDHPKWVHWRTSARLGELAVRQFEQQRRFELCILLDGFSSGDERDSRFAEDAISLAAALIVELVGTPSNQVVLAIAGDQAATVVSGGNDLGKRKMLEALAAVKFTTKPPITKAINEAFERVGRTRDLIVISPRSLSLASLAQPQLREAMAPWSRGGSVLRWLDCGDPELRRWVSFDVNNHMSSGGQPDSSVSRSELEAAS